MGIPFLHIICDLEQFFPQELIAGCTPLPWLCNETADNLSHIKPNICLGPSFQIYTPKERGFFPGTSLCLFIMCDSSQAVTTLRCKVAVCGNATVMVTSLDVRCITSTAHKADKAVLHLLGILIGASGVGKTALINSLISKGKEFSKAYKLVIVTVQHCPTRSLMHLLYGILCDLVHAKLHKSFLFRLDDLWMMMSIERGDLLWAFSCLVMGYDNIIPLLTL